MAAVKRRRGVHGRPHFLIVFVLCCLLSALLAAPVTRSHKAFYPIRDTAAVTQVNAGEGRMDIELTDYPGPGANTGHEPVTPPKP